MHVRQAFLIFSAPFLAAPPFTTGAKAVLEGPVFKDDEHPVLPLGVLAGHRLEDLRGYELLDDVLQLALAIPGIDAEHLGYCLADPHLRARMFSPPPRARPGLVHLLLDLIDG